MASREAGCRGEVLAPEGGLDPAGDAGVALAGEVGAAVLAAGAVARVAMEGNGAPMCRTVRNH